MAMSVVSNGTNDSSKSGKASRIARGGSGISSTPDATAAAAAATAESPSYSNTLPKSITALASVNNSPSNEATTPPSPQHERQKHSAAKHGTNSARSAKKGIT